MKNNYNLYLERPVNPERYRLIRKFGEGRYLDVGCGNGKYLSQVKIDGLPFKCFSGVDHQSFESWEEIDAEFEVSDVHTLPYSDGQFDTVSCFELLEHVERPSDVI